MKIQPAKFQKHALVRDARFGEPLTIRLQTAPLPVAGPRPPFKFEPRALAAKRKESGMATVIFIALLAIMLVLVMVETSSLIRLRREVKLLEKQQIKRLNSPQTNVMSAAANATNN